METANQDYEWASKGLLQFQREEITATERLKKAEAGYAGAKAELAEARENLKGVRGCIAEMAWQKEFFEEHGRLP